MADWDEPALTDTYSDFLSMLKLRDVDAASLKESSSNTPTGYIQWAVATNKLQRWNGAAWVDLVLSVAGGGTAGVVALGTMAFQNSNANGTVHWDLRTSEGLEIAAGYYIYHVESKQTGDVKIGKFAALIR